MSLEKELAFIDIGYACFAIPKFDGEREKFTAWLSKVERVFACCNLNDQEKLKVAISKLRGCALHWWTCLCAKRVRERKPKIRTWEKMKSKLKARFLPFTYVQDSYSEPHHLIQGSLNVEEHIREFEKLPIKSDPQEPNEQTVSKGISFHTPNPTTPPFPTPQKDLSSQKNLPSQSTPKGVLSHVKNQSLDYLASEYTIKRCITPAEWNRSEETKLEELEEEKEGEYVEETKEEKIEEEEIELEADEGEYLTLDVTQTPKSKQTKTLPSLAFGEIESMPTPSTPSPPQTLSLNFCHFYEAPTKHIQNSKGMNEEQVFKTKQDLFTWLILFQPIVDPTVKVCFYLTRFEGKSF